MATAETQGDPERHCSDLYTRTGWVNAAVALGQLEQVMYTVYLIVSAFYPANFRISSIKN